MRVATFIVLDDPLKRSSKEYERTLNGEVYFPLETPMPIIVKGKGCIGIGMVSELRITKSSTTITFRWSNVNEADANAYYALYRNQVSVSDDNTDPYDQSDAIIPGMMTSVNKKVDYTPDTSPRRRSRGILDIADEDDDYHW